MLLLEILTNKHENKVQTALEKATLVDWKFENNVIRLEHAFETPTRPMCTSYFLLGIIILIS